MATPSAEPVPLDEDADPDDLPWGTTITARAWGREGIRLVRADTDSLCWFVHPDDVREGTLWAFSQDLEDVMVLQLGPSL
jgi:hypothetical protein